jgi:CheY-like chemotaxis protein
MFDPYFTTKPKGEGTGLGLAIVKGIIDGLNGKIEVNSEKGEGSLFTIWIPRFTGGTETTEELLEEKNEAKQNQEVRVIFIDDEDALVELFEGYLESHGMKVSSFNEGKSALAALDQNPDSWDIMVSDISLPEMDGLEIVRRLRISNKKLPVILYSGFKRPSFLEQARKLGVSSMLIKPVVPEDMLKEIKAVLLEKEIKHD